MRALAHPVRLAILSRLQRHGPATATELSEHVDASPSVTSWHLRHLAASAWSATATPVIAAGTAASVLGGGRPGVPLRGRPATRRAGRRAGC